MPLLIKKYQNGKLTPNILGSKFSKNIKLEISSPKGQGLLLNQV